MPINTMSTTEQLAPQVIGEFPEWGASYVLDLLDVLTSSEAPFPCTFAVSAANKASLRFAFVEDLEDKGTWEVLPSVISSYLEVYRELTRETSLIVLFRRQEKTAEIARYYTKFWDVLQFLHDRDPEPWPPEIPQRTDDSGWEFSFGGTPMFVVCNTPAHLVRRSRASPGFMITFQPRWVFEELGADTAKGAAARRGIRVRLRDFDGTEASPHLGNYGDPDNREWRQYFLPEDNIPLPGRCPFKHR